MHNNLWHFIQQLGYLPSYGLYHLWGANFAFFSETDTLGFHIVIDILIYFLQNMFKYFLALSLLFINGVQGCVSGSCKNGMCSDIPSNGQYYLTSFCDKSVACGSFSGNCNEYYSAGYTRFGCNSISKFFFLIVKLVKLKKYTFFQFPAVRDLIV